MIEPNQVPIDSESLSALNSNQQYSLLSPLYGNFYSSYEDEFNIDCKFYDEQNLVKSIKEKEADFLIASLNCQSFRAKNNEILSFIDSLNNNNIQISLFNFQETWFNVNDNISIHNIAGYKWYVRSRQNRMGGGVGTLIKSEYNVKELFEKLTYNQDIIESICLKCSYKKTKFITLNVYRPPNQSVDQLEKFFDILSTILDKLADYDIPLYVTGDFNLDILKSEDLNSNPRRLIELFTYYGILNTITRATRITRETKSLIDLIGVGNGINDLVLSSVLTTSISDHLLILNGFKLNNSSKNQPEKSLIFLKKGS